MHFSLAIGNRVRNHTKRLQAGSAETGVATVHPLAGQAWFRLAAIVAAVPAPFIPCCIMRAVVRDRLTQSRPILKATLFASIVADHVQYMHIAARNVA